MAEREEDGYLFLNEEERADLMALLKTIYKELKEDGDGPQAETQVWYTRLYNHETEGALSQHEAGMLSGFLFTVSFALKSRNHIDARAWSYQIDDVMKHANETAGVRRTRRTVAGPGR